MVAGIGVFLLGEAFFSGSELALVSADRVKLRRRAEAGNRAARLALTLLASSDRLLTVTLLGTNVSQVSSAVIAHELWARVWGPSRAFYSALVMIPLVVTLGEAVPKALMRQHADTLVLRVVYPLALAERLAAPLVAVLSSTVKVLTRALARVLGVRTLPSVTREELGLLVKMVEARGFSTPEESELIRRLMVMSDRKVRESMVPVADVVSAGIGVMPREVARLARTMGYSRVFIHDGGTGNIRGFVHIMDLLDLEPDGPDVARIVREATYIPEQARLEVVLRDFLANRREVAVVVDEYGATTGIVSLEDLVEVIVGEISDEFDRPRGLQLEELGDRTLVVDARVHVDELAHRGFDLPQLDGVATVAGLLMEIAQRVPKAGEIFEVQNARFEVLSASDRRVKRVRVEMVEPGPPLP